MNRPAKLERAIFAELCRCNVLDGTTILVIPDPTSNEHLLFLGVPPYKVNVIRYANPEVEEFDDHVRRLYGDGSSPLSNPSTGL